MSSQRPASQLSAVALAIMVTTGVCEAAETVLVSQINNGSPSISNSPALSHDGNVVAFTSTNGTLVGDANRTKQIYVKNLTDNSIVRASVNSSGVAANGVSNQPTISANGRYVSFFSWADNLVSNDTNGVVDIFVRDLQTNTTQLVSADVNGIPANAESADAVISADGRYVAFASQATNLVPTVSNGKRHIYVKDLQTGDIEIVSVNSSGVAADEGSFLNSMSADGRYVTFNSFANNLDDNAPNNQYDIFVHDRMTKVTERVTQLPDGTLSNNHSTQANINDDGRFIAYASMSDNLVPGDNNGVMDIFVYDRQTGETERVTPVSGEDPNGASLSPKLSANGRFVAFYSSATNLHPLDTNGKDDLFIYDRYLNRIEMLNLNNDGSISDAGIDFTIALSGDGQVGAFASTGNLSPDDTDSFVDVYIHRRDPIQNIPPVAQAASIAAQECVNGGAFVTLDATASYDPDYDALGYLWDGPFGQVIGEVQEGFVGVGDNTISLTVSDTAGGRDSDSVVASVYDTINPTISADAPVVLEATSTSGATHNVGYVADDSCALSGTSMKPASNVYPLGTTTVELTAFDTVGNTAKTSTEVTVQDTTAPVLNIPGNITAEANAVLSNIDLGNATANDIFPVTVTNNAPSGFPLGNTNVTWNATDANGNSSSKVQNVKVQDTTPPSLNIPADMILEAMAASMTVDIGIADANDIFPVTLSNNAPAMFSLGSTPIIWTATDANGNSASAIQTVTIADTQPPIISLPKNDIVLEATSLAGASYDLKYDITDACNCGPLDIVIDPELSVYPLGKTEVSIRATDISGNAANSKANVSVQDTTAPTLTIPADIEMEATGMLTPISIGAATADDIFPVTVTHDAPTVFPVGDTSITWTATDSNGNITRKIQHVNVVDTIAPTFEMDVEKDEIWPPNHKLVESIEIEHINDIVDANPKVELFVTSNGDHNKDPELPDWQLVKDDDDDGEAEWKVLLRAEKLNTPNTDRVYSIEVRVTDFSGNSTSKFAEVIVPANQSEHGNSGNDNEHSGNNGHNDNSDEGHNGNDGHNDNNDEENDD